MHVCSDYFHVCFVSYDSLPLQLLWSVVVFTVGALVDGMMSVVGLSGMEVAPPHMASSAHGFVCAFSQGMYMCVYVGTLLYIKFK